jgi:glycosyltransferase involved in cell wall biosynthesis
VNRPRVSVIIAAFNCQDHLGACLASLQQQTFTGWEAWICDDASTDGTWGLLVSLAGADPRIHLLRNDTNRKAAATRNRCLDRAAGDYVAIQDADDLMAPERLARLFAFLENRPDLAFVSSGMFLLDAQGTFGQIVHPQTPTIQAFLWSLPFSHAPTLFRRAALVEVQGYRVAAETTRGQDYDLFMRLVAKGFRGHNLPDLLYGYRVDRASYQRRQFRFRVDECRIRYRGFKALGLLPWGLPFVLKPILLGLAPARWLGWFKGIVSRWVMNRR